MPFCPDILVKVQGLHVDFIEEDGSLEVLDGLDFSLEKGSFNSIVGLSGSGKSTLLRTLAGLIKPSAGYIDIDGKKPAAAKIGMVFQKPNLFPWRRLNENIALPLELENVPRAEIERRVAEMVGLVRLTGSERRYPHELSGGMAQRASIARALIREPKILLLDEPFGQLDAITRAQMGDEILRIWREKKQTVLMVTHSITEAVYLSDRVIVLSARPAVIKKDMRIDLPRPRQTSMQYMPAFTEICSSLQKTLLNE